MLNATVDAIASSTSLPEDRRERYSKSMSNKPSRLTLHYFLGALSFWGTAVRLMLFTFIAIVVLVIALTEATDPMALDRQIMVLIYVLASFSLLDFGYVMVARAYPLQKQLDLVALVLVDIFLAMLYIVPKLVVSSTVQVVTDPLTYIFFIPLIVIAVRMLLGFLFAGRK